MLHVLSGEAEYLEKLKAASVAGRALSWIVPKKAVPGDDTVMYFPHLDAFVAHGEVLHTPKATMFGRAQRYAADVGNFVVFPSPVPLIPVAAKYPDWGWPRAATKSLNTPPPEVQAGLLYALEQMAIRASDVEPILEGLARESRTMRKTRNRGLRNEAMRRARGVCEGCGTDYSKVVDGRGVCVLEVHHRRQLALNAVPVISRLADLAVVCANCHAFIHADAQQALAVRDVRTLLPSGWRVEQKPSGRRAKSARG